MSEYVWEAMADHLYDAHNFSELEKPEIFKKGYMSGYAQYEVALFLLLEGGPTPPDQLEKLRLKMREFIELPNTATTDLTAP